MNSGFFGHAADAKERLAFAPPKLPGLVRAFALAVIAHLLLLLALMHGLQWKRETQDAAAEAELWSAVPQQAAPREVVPPPPPPPPLVQAPPRPEPPPPVVKAPEPPPQRDADIALEREKQKRELQKKKLAEERALEKKLQAQEEREERRKLEAQKRREEEVARRKEEARAEKADKAERAKQAAAAEAKLAAAEARRREDDKRRKQEQDTKKLAQMRDDNMKRMQGLAGSSGSPTAGGTAVRSAGPSANWGGKVQDLVMPKITFLRETSASWVTDVEVRMAPDGTIVSKKVVKSSGSRDWDEAVLAALEKAERLPRDTDGRVPTPVVIGFRPRR
jgi:colicin import membrane protein